MLVQRLFQVRIFLNTLVQPLYLFKASLSTVLLKSKLPPSRETRIESREILSLETRVSSRESVKKLEVRLLELLTRF